MIRSLSSAVARLSEWQRAIALAVQHILQTRYPESEIVKTTSEKSHSGISQSGVASARGPEMAYYLGARSRLRLVGVHPDLVKVVKRAIEITAVDFTVLEGVRSYSRQRTLVAKGASKTMNSRHLTGHAVDLGAYVGGQVRWDWPLYYDIADAMKQAAKDVSVPVEWGGDWTNFKDGPHWQLPWREYPK